MRTLLVVCPEAERAAGLAAGCSALAQVLDAAVAVPAAIPAAAAAEAARASRTPALVIPAGATVAPAAPGRVALAVELTDDPPRALEAHAVAADLSRRLGIPLVLIGVHPGISSWLDPQAATELLVERAAGRGAGTVSGGVHHCPPSREAAVILEAVARAGADLLVLGESSRGPADDGLVAAVVAGAGCPVLIVPQPAPAPAEPA